MKILLRGILCHSRAMNCMTTQNNIELLFKAHYDKMYRLALALLHDEDLAHDIVHEVFAALIESPPVEIGSHAYLLRAVRNRCLSHIRDCGIHERIENRYFVENKEYDDEDWPDEETMSRIHLLINSNLTPQARRVMQLRFSEGMKFEKIAAAMGISQTAVFRHMNNALKIIRQKLRENG